ncbi:MAG: ATP synthase subunit I [Nitrosomonadales bacterium]|nr:ATP synthase subunit I [Nitrosomonadales bacterium]
MDSEKGDKSGGNEHNPDRNRLTPKLNAAIIPALFKAEVQEQQLARRVVRLQILITLAAAGVAYGLKSSPQYAIAVLGGGGVSVLNGTLLAWRVSRSTLHPAHDAHLQLRLMYYYAAERFLAVVTALGLCLAAFKLPPLAVLSGFVLGQATLLAARLLLKIKIESGVKNVQ